MKRDLHPLAQRAYDLLVVGGGIYGACIAWDAALRGLSVALIEQGDFGHATSAQSLKIIHGGLRYLQEGKLPLVRQMSRERAAWLRIAPHLVHPLPCLMPTTSKLTRSRAALSVALTINDWLAQGFNRMADPQKRLPAGQVISRAECLSRLPGLDPKAVTGGALWYDGQIYNTERLVLSVVLSAAEAGAEVANYVKATTFLQEQMRVTGARATDVLSGQEFDIRARLVVNCSGAWIDSLLEPLVGHSAPRFHLSTAINLVTRQILADTAVGLAARLPDAVAYGRARSQVLFIVPWRQYSIIGTLHQPHAGAQREAVVTESAVAALLGVVNAVYPPAALTREDVYHIHAGFLPAAATPAGRGPVRLVREGRIHDHRREDGIEGLLSVVGVKFTAARHVAETLVDLALDRLGRAAAPCPTRDARVWDGHIERFDDFRAHAIARRPFGLSPETMQHLVYAYGSQYERIVAYVAGDSTQGQPLSDTTCILRAEVIHAVREEMACTLGDVVLRRTELGSAGRPDETALQHCADLVAAELGWTGARRAQEVARVAGAYRATCMEPNELAARPEAA